MAAMVRMVAAVDHLVTRIQATPTVALEVARVAVPVEAQGRVSPATAAVVTAVRVVTMPPTSLPVLVPTAVRHSPLPEMQLVMKLT